MNVTVELIDSYAGLAYMGGNNIIGKTGLAHEAIIFFNRYFKMNFNICVAPCRFAKPGNFKYLDIVHYLSHGQ